MACPEGQYFCNDRGKCMPIPKGHKVRKDGELVKEVAPPGWGHTKAEKEKTDPSKPKSKIGGTAAAFKKALDDGRFKVLPGSKTKKEKTADMFKLMWSMKKKGDKPHYKPGTDEKYKKYQKEELSTKDAKNLNKASVLSQSDDPKDQDRARARQVEVDYKDLLRQLKSKRKMKEDWKPEIEHSKLGDAVKKKAEKKRKEAESSLPPHLRLDAMKKAFAHTNESFEIDKDAHNKAKKKAKLRNLAKGNENPAEKEAAEKKAGGPKLAFEGFLKKAADAMKKVVNKKEEEEKKSSMDPTTQKLHKWRKDKEREERHKYVSPFDPIEKD